MSKTARQTIPSPRKREQVMDSAHYENGRALANSARSWMESNQSAFMAIYSFVKSLQYQHVNGRLRDRVAVFCVNNNIKVGNDVYTFANGTWAAIARYLVIYDKTLLDAPVKLNPSDLDLFGLWPISWMEVGK